MGNFYTLDTETRGLFGDIFRWRAYDGENFIGGYSAKDLSDWLDCFTDPAHIYVHNLEYDLSKILKIGALKLDIDESMLLNGKLVKACIIDNPIIFHCSYHILKSSLASLSESFELHDNGKMDIKTMIQEQTLLKPSGKPYKDLDEYFRLVPKDDPLLNEYLDRDCSSLHRILCEVKEFSGLGDKFFNIMTTPQLSIAVFRTMFPQEYKMLITKNIYNDEQEAFFRQAYNGANTQVFRPRLPIGKDPEKPSGYHYDFNSLYPYVMKTQKYPIGSFREETDPKICEKVWGIILRHPEHYPVGIIEATVIVPDAEKYPVLPIHHDGRLMFLTGKIHGTWTLAEIQYAIERGLEMVAIHHIVVWRNTFNYFENFINYCGKGKLESKGGKREFFKAVMNNGYGKIGMNRRRNVYMFDSIKNREKMVDKENISTYESCLLGNIIQGEIEIPKYECRYVNPHIAAHITAYARLELIKLIHYCQATKRKIYYCDTDSLVVDKPLPTSMTDEKEFGKLKLESLIKEAVFVQPKMYAESFFIPKDFSLEIPEKTESVKAKGIPHDILKTISYQNMVRMQERIEAGERYIEIFKDYQDRGKFIMQAKHNRDIDEIVYRRKTIDASIRPKRRMDYALNDSFPWNLQELEKEK